jgi:hypothetical protein
VVSFTLAATSGPLRRRIDFHFLIRSVQRLPIFALRVERAANHHHFHYIVTALPVYEPFLYEMIAIP